MASEYDEHFTIERKYKVWTSLPDNKATQKLKEYCGENSIMEIDKRDGFVIVTTQSKMMKFQMDTKEMVLIVEMKEDKEDKE